MALSIVPQLSHAGVFQELVDAILKLTASVASLTGSVDRLTDEVDELNDKADSILHFLEGQTPIALELLANFTAALNHGVGRVVEAIHPLGHAADILTDNVGITAVYVVGTAVFCYKACKLVRPVARTLHWVTSIGVKGVRRRWATYRVQTPDGRPMRVLAMAPVVDDAEVEGPADSPTVEIDFTGRFPKNTVLLVNDSGDETSDELTSTESTDQRRSLLRKKHRKYKRRRAPQASPVKQDDASDDRTGSCAIL
jgi:hypothetical protein